MTCISSEAKLELMTRLRREGRWEAATEFREQRRLQARRDGLSKDAAKETAWAQMAEHFQAMSEEELAIEPAIRWFVMGGFPHQSIVAIEDRESVDVSYANVWQGVCAAIALLHARRQNGSIVSFQITEMMIQLVNDAPDNIQLRLVFARVLSSPHAFLRRYAVSRLSDLLRTNDQMHPDDHAELSLLVATIQQMTPENVDEVLAKALA
ncbi:MAG TPA: hypothetical protein DDZ51_18155 [Planctomycetaceae bacterium]|nr:hypothetical protein [Planctomycetaceae bacterium]